MKERRAKYEKEQAAKKAAKEAEGNERQDGEVRALYSFVPFYVRFRSWPLNACTGVERVCTSIG